MLDAKSGRRHTFKLRGKVSHSMPPTSLPEEQKKALFSQIYIYDSEEQNTLKGEIQNKSDTIINDMVYTMLKKVSNIVIVISSYKFIKKYYLRPNVS